MKQYFEILELQPGATPDEVKRAYRDLAKVWHPDRFKGDSPRLKSKAAEKLAEINNAYEKIKAYQARQKARKQAGEGHDSMHSGYNPYSTQRPAPGNGQSYSGYSRPTTGRTQPRSRSSVYSQPNTYRRKKHTSSTRPRTSARTGNTQRPNYSTNRSTSESSYRTTQDPSNTLTRKYHPATVQYGPYGRNYGYTYHKRRRSKNPTAIYLTVVALLAVVVASAYIYIKKSEEQAQPTLADYTLDAMPRDPVVESNSSQSGSNASELTTAEVDPINPSMAQSAAVPSINPAKHSVPPVPAGMFTLGSSKNQVIKAQGEPEQVRANLFRYGFSTIFFDNNVVVGWHESADTPLKVQLNPRKTFDSEFFTVGSTRDEVLAVQGTPDHYRDRGREFRYGESRITFERGRVVSWHQHPNYPLRAKLLPRVPSNAEYFTHNSSRDVVLSVQGTPDHFGENTFHYGYSTVQFENERVVGWNQTPNHPLNVVLEPSVPTSSKFFTIGSSRDEVIAAQGTPDQYSQRMFKFGYSTVSFDDNRVVSWYQSAASPLNVRSDTGGD